MTHGQACPICKAPRQARYRPFCSSRCAEIDLGRWFTGNYAVPAEEPPEGFDADFVPPGPPANDDDEFL
jgi:uncharacterized protein